MFYPISQVSESPTRIKQRCTMTAVDSLRLLVFLGLACCSAFYRIEDQIYLRLEGGSNQCFRLLNGTSQIGCQSEPNGNTGIVVYANSDAEIERIVSKVAQVTDMQYVIAIDVDSLDGKVIEKLRSDRIRGVLLLSDTNRTRRPRMQFSEDSECPNERFNLYNDTCTWNKRGAVVMEGFRFIDWNKPIFLIKNDTEIEIVRKRCFEAFNIDRTNAFSPFCAARMKFFMRGAGNAEICLRRQEYFYGLSEAVVALCDPLEDENVITMLPPSSKENINNETKIFVLAARMDSFSTLTEGPVGDVSTLTSLISTLAVVDAMGRYADEFQLIANKKNKCLMFAFFHGESMGYIGSSRVVYDMLQGNFPAKPDSFAQSDGAPLVTVNVSNIDVFIEMQQLDGAGSAFFAHVDGQSYKQHEQVIGTLLAAADKELQRRNRSISLVDHGENGQVPPSSYQSFLKQNRSIAGFVFAPFDGTYTYKALNSFADAGVFDEEHRVIVEEITASASAALATILEYFYGTTKTTLPYEVDEGFVSTLFNCFIVESDWYSCDFFAKILQNVKNRPEEGTKSTYISGGDRLPSLIRLLVNAIIVHSLGKEMVNVTSESQCNDLNKAQQIYRYTWQVDPVKNSSACFRTALYPTPAKSPAFEIDGHDLSTSFYSTWVESVWVSQDLVLFLVPAAYPRYDLGLFVGACAFFAVCFFIMEAFCFGVNEPADQASLESDPL
uniref:Nicastrin n=1 Tax=Ascaris lumbricoides TaxID=6252 RepID=A0A9J2P9Z1_ASCLU